MSQSSNGPLSGIMVLDLTQFLAGPYATQILADLGAEVIKVESPEGDFARNLPPHFVGADSVYYLSINRSKKSVSVDLKNVDDLEWVRSIALQSDIVIENFRPGVLKRIGLDHEEIRNENRRIIWCSISGFGQTGPYRSKPAYDMIVQALSGGMSMTGEPGRPSVRAGIPIGDISAGMYAIIGCLSALERRHKTGLGDYIDVAMLDCQLAMTCYQSAYYFHSGHVPGRQGRGHDSIPTYHSFEARDGVEIVITANTERMWQSLCRALDVPQLVEDPRFRTNAQRLENREVLWEILGAKFSERNADELVAELEAKNIPVGTVNTMDRVATDPQVIARDMIVSMDAGDGREFRTMGNPIKFAEIQLPEPTYPPKLGEHNDLYRVSGVRTERLKAKK